MTSNRSLPRLIGILLLVVTASFGCAAIADNDVGAAKRNKADAPGVSKVEQGQSIESQASQSPDNDAPPTATASDTEEVTDTAGARETGAASDTAAATDAETTSETAKTPQPATASKAAESDKGYVAPAPCAGGGRRVLGACWYLGALYSEESGTKGQSCTEVCKTRGGYDAATETLVGSQGTDENCKAVAKALGKILPFGNSTSAASSAFGCAVGELHRNLRLDYVIRNGTPGDTEDVTGFHTFSTKGQPINSGRSRICACKI